MSPEANETQDAPETKPENPTAPPPSPDAGNDGQSTENGNCESKNDCSEPAACSPPSSIAEETEFRPLPVEYLEICSEGFAIGHAAAGGQGELAGAIRTGALEDQIRNAVGILSMVAEMTPFKWDDWIADTLDKVVHSNAFPVFVQMVKEFFNDQGPATGTEEAARQQVIAGAGLSWTQVVSLIPQIVRLIRRFR